MGRHKKKVEERAFFDAAIKNAFAHSEVNGFDYETSLEIAVLTLSLQLEKAKKLFKEAIEVGPPPMIVVVG